MRAPLATAEAYNEVVLSTRGQMEALFRVEIGLPIFVGKQVVYGGGAGIVVYFLTFPTKLIKCRLKAQSALATASVVTLGVT